MELNLNGNYIVLYNQDRFQPFLVSLYHACMCKKKCICKHEVESGYLGAPEEVRKEQSLWIGPQEYSTGLPREVLDIPQVKVAIKNGQLSIANQLAKIQQYTYVKKEQ